MHAAEKSPWKYLVLWLRLYFAIHYLASGLNFVIFNFVPDFSHAGRVGPYLHAMADIGFYQVIKYLEVVLGTMLLFNLAVPLALIVMAGVSVTIIYLNLFISPAPRQLFTGIQELLLNGACCSPTVGTTRISAASRQGRSGFGTGCRTRHALKRRDNCG